MKDRPNLDILRSLAVILVVVSHLRNAASWSESQQAVYHLDTVGLIGVMVFFVHTTLVLMLSLERHGPEALPFLIRRAFRIYPLAIVAVLVMAAFRWRGGSLDIGELGSNLLLIQNLTGHESWPEPLWTLPYEVQMYLFLPGVFALTRWPRASLWITLLCAIAILLGPHPQAKAFPLLQFVPCFLSGALAYVLARGNTRELSPWLLFGLVGGAVVVLPLLVATGVPQLPLFWGFCLALGLMIPMCRQVTNTFLSGIGGIVATYSYGVYLCHAFAIKVAFGELRHFPEAVQWPVFIVLMIALPYCAYRFVEGPGIRVGKRLAERMVRPPAASTAAAN